MSSAPRTRLAVSCLLLSSLCLLGMAWFEAQQPLPDRMLAREVRTPSPEPRTPNPPHLAKLEIYQYLLQEERADVAARFEQKKAGEAVEKSAPLPERSLETAAPAAVQTDSTELKVQREADQKQQRRAELAARAAWVSFFRRFSGAL